MATVLGKRELYGGAITVDLPTHLYDVSFVRHLALRATTDGASENVVKWMTPRRYSRTRDPMQTKIYR
jgi:hypothetical protein